LKSVEIWGLRIGFDVKLLMVTNSYYLMPPTDRKWLPAGNYRAVLPRFPYSIIMKDPAFAKSVCPMTRTMGVLGGKWKPIIIVRLGQKRVRFGQLAQKMDLISRKVLTEQLKELEEDGLVLREAFAELPPRVEYRLSPRGLALLPILNELCQWHCDEFPLAAV
jgi:DNA-binding HxlR family transcriptional regulator